MNDDIAIRVEGLGKRYRLGTMRKAYDLLSENIGDFVRSRVLHRQAQEKPPDDQILWALKDISFEVKRGEVLGIIGRNGAGKSTLLKILSRITTPTEGRAEIHGRVGSLLEVGTGFHMELTGRENIYLNGSILGMSRDEIAAKYDEIVEFSEIDRFIDTPVKRYSSGMKIRLGFAVAAHLQPEILLVDEVLAVGDEAFQRKCLGKMGNIAATGSTVVFVSHNLQTVRRLCQRGMIIENGSISKTGEVDLVIHSYLEQVVGPDQDAMDISQYRKTRMTQEFDIDRVEIRNSQGVITNLVLMDEEIEIRIFFRIQNDSRSYRIGLVFRAQDGTRIATLVSTHNGKQPIRVDSNKTYLISVRTHGPLLPGSYYIDINAKNSHDKYVFAVEGFPFTIAPVGKEEKVYDGVGIIRMENEWSDIVPVENWDAISDCGGSNNSKGK
ncbi:MAG: ABC transporter ATP-binding protein [Candidatus Alcyoniella australis]|nr:ABC transporter ATP-binding protein [Candidatus Alcyoniella australis]